MSNPLRTSEDYELFLYTLDGQFSSVRRSTVTFIRCGAALARVAGDFTIRRVNDASSGINLPLPALVPKRQWFYK